MAKVVSFEFFTDPVLGTGASTCTINWGAQTVVYPGVAGLSFQFIDELVDIIDELADQDVTDLEATTQKVVYKSDGSTAITVSAVVDAVAGTVATVAPGSVPFSVIKAKDLAQGLRDFVLV